jgi:hypothetical protein
MEQVDRDRLENHLDDLSYPVTRADAAAAFAETEVVTGDDAANLGRLISEVGSDAFRSSAELADELDPELPTRGDAG